MELGPLTNFDMERCDEEIRQIRAMTDKPAWLTALGEVDWQAEKRFIDEERAEHA